MNSGSIQKFLTREDYLTFLNSKHLAIFISLDLKI